MAGQWRATQPERHLSARPRGSHLYHTPARTPAHALAAYAVHISDLHSQWACAGPRPVARPWAPTVLQVVSHVSIGPSPMPRRSARECASEDRGGGEGGGDRGGIEGGGAELGGGVGKLQERVSALEPSAIQCPLPALACAHAERSRHTVSEFRSHEGAQATSDNSAMEFPTPAKVESTTRSKIGPKMLRGRLHPDTFLDLLLSFSGQFW